MTNEGQIDMMKNMLTSAKKAGFPMLDIHCYVMSTNKEAASYNTANFQLITLRKLEIILENMQQSSEVFWIDNDIIFFDTFSNIISNIKSYNGQFIMQDDMWSVCTGFFFVKSTPVSLRVIQKSIDWLRKQLNNPALNDQHAFNNCYRSVIGCLVSKLPQEEYPNGRVYFENNKKDKARMLHNNFLVGTDAKIDRFKANNMWEIDDNIFHYVRLYHI